MKKALFLMIVLAGMAVTLWPVAAQNRLTSARPANNADNANHGNDGNKANTTEQIVPEEIIRRFTTKESELREMWKEYSYIQETRFQVLGPADTVSGEFYQVSEFVFDDSGKRRERILKAPPSTLEYAGLRMTQEDRNALINLQPFALAKEDLPNYTIGYIGKEKVDELNTYVFDVIPKVMSNPRELDKLRKQKIEGKFFQGKIWVDDQDLQIVKTAGKTVPEFEQRFPKFETYRENIDGRYWFPTYTYGDDRLAFDRLVHVRMVIKYQNYRRFQSDIKFLDSAEEVKEDKKPEEPGKAGETKKDETKKEDTKSDSKKDEKAKPVRPRP